MAEEVTLQQAVFGYDAGHNLLESSCEILSESRRMLAVLTDASGSWPRSGFECVFTGTPLPDMPLYALFCTWPAPEMPRPGCVWSHVLLLELADLAAIDDLSQLRRFFRRPQGPEDASFREPKRFIATHRGAAPVVASQEDDCSSFVRCLYATPEIPCMVEAQAEETYSDLVFALWSQQWPRLRRSFRFSTGSFSDRGRLGPPFDLQVMPRGTRRSWQIASNVIVDELGKEKKPNPEAWCNTAVKDLRAPDCERFRSFLQTYGVDLESPRAAFARLANAFDLMAEHQAVGWTDKLRRIAGLFPKASEALRLKASLLAALNRLSEPESIQQAEKIASFLCDHSEANAYANVSCDLTGLAKLLWRGNRELVFSLLSRSLGGHESPVVRNLAVALADALHPKELQSVVCRLPELIRTILDRRPALAFEVASWDLPSSLQTQIYESLSNLALAEEDWARVVGALFNSTNHFVLNGAVEKARSHAVNGAFCWLEHESADHRLPSEAWRQALAEPAAVLLRSGEQLEPARLALCSWLVGPERGCKSLCGTRPDVQRLAENSTNALPCPLRVPTAFLLLTLGLKEPGGAGIKLIVSGFYAVHDALASNSFPSESWSLLAPELPSLGWWNYWDYCEKLRLAVRNRANRDLALRDMLVSAADTPQQRELARQVFDSEADEEAFWD